LLTSLLQHEDWPFSLSGKNRFPSSIPTHYPEQFFTFDTGTGLLVRHDYTAEVMGNWAKAANVVLEYGYWNGIPYPSKRRITPRWKDGTPARRPVLIAIDIHDWRLV
jgi:hypothetical protein